MANDAALRQAQQMEDRLRTRDLVQGAEAFVDFYDQQLPRQVSSAASLEHYSRHLSKALREALRLTPARIFARLPEAETLAQFPEQTRVDALTVPVEYHFAPGDAQDGANLKVPLLALPGLTRAMIDAAIPGLAAPRIEALLRSLPKDARRSLIPMAATAAQFLADGQAAPADAEQLKVWLKEKRGMAESLLRFDPKAVPAHLTPQLTVTQTAGKSRAARIWRNCGRECAAAGRARSLKAARGRLTAFVGRGVDSNSTSCRSGYLWLWSKARFGCFPLLCNGT